MVQTFDEDWLASLGDRYLREVVHLNPVLFLVYCLWK